MGKRIWWGRTSTVEYVGTISKLQVQCSSLKVGQPPRCRYDPATIVDLPALTLDVGGVRG
jgi:hypothetical protein